MPEFRLLLPLRDRMRRGLLAALTRLRRDQDRRSRK